MYHRLTFSRFLNEYPHVTLALSGFFGAILLLFFLWMTLFLGLHPAQAASGVDECSSYPLHGSTTAVLKDGTPNSGVFYFDPASVPATPSKNIYLPPVTKRACAVKIAGSKNLQMKGWAWNDNFGWTSFYCPGSGGNNLGAFCGDYKYGVTIDDTGKFSGYAWSNAGWIRFTCNDSKGQFNDKSDCSASKYGVSVGKIDQYGYAPVVANSFALSSNVGWINFSGVQIPFQLNSLQSDTLQPLPNPLVLDDQDGDGIITDADVILGNPTDPWNPGGSNNTDESILQLTGVVGLNSSVALSWTDLKYDSQVFYHVYRSDAALGVQKGDGVFGLQEVANVKGKTSNQIVPATNKDFYYIVAVLDANKKIVKISNNFKVNIQASVNSLTPVVSTLLLTGTVGSNNAFNLSWSDPLYSPGALYHVYRSDTLMTVKKGDGAGVLQQVWIGLSNTNQQIVPENDKYFYYIVAVLDAAQKKIVKISNNLRVSIKGTVSIIPVGGSPAGSSGSDKVCTPQDCPPFSAPGPDKDTDGYSPNTPPPFQDCNDDDGFINPASPDQCSNTCNGVVPDSCNPGLPPKPVADAAADYTFNIPYTIGNSYALGEGALSLGSALRADVRNLIFKNVQQLKRSASTQCGSLGNILYFQPQDDVYYCKGDVTIGPVAPWTGRKTLIVEDGNVFIRGDIFPDDFNAQLGLIVLRSNLKDSTKANVYLGPKVHNLRLQLFADGSMFPGVEDVNNMKKVKKLGGSAAPDISDVDYSATAGGLFGQLFLQGLFVTHNNMDLESYFDVSKLNKKYPNAQSKYPDASGKNTIIDPNIGKLYSFSFLRAVPKNPKATAPLCKTQNVVIAGSEGKNACAQSWSAFSKIPGNEEKSFVSSKLLDQYENIAKNEAHGVVIFYEPPADDLPGFTNLGAASAVQR